MQLRRLCRSVTTQSCRSQSRRPHPRSSRRSTGASSFLIPHVEAEADAARKLKDSNSDIKSDLVSSPKAFDADEIRNKVQV